MGTDSSLCEGRVSCYLLLYLFPDNGFCGKCEGVWRESLVMCAVEGREFMVDVCAVHGGES